MANLGKMCNKKSKETGLILQTYSSTTASAVSTSWSRTNQSGVVGWTRRLNRIITINHIIMIRIIHIIIIPRIIHTIPTTWLTEMDCLCLIKGMKKRRGPEPSPEASPLIRWWSCLICLLLDFLVDWMIDWLIVYNPGHVKNIKSELIEFWICDAHSNWS